MAQLLPFPESEAHGVVGIYVVDARIVGVNMAQIPMFHNLAIAWCKISKTRAIGQIVCFPFSVECCMSYVVCCRLSVKLKVITEGENPFNRADGI